MSQLTLHFDDDPKDLPRPRGSAPFAWKPRLTPVDVTRRDPVIAGAQETLDRMDRQMQNLRELLGPNWSGPKGTRAA